MKWKTKVVKEGDRRIRYVFALIPKDCVDGQTRWLETVKITEKYKHCWSDASWEIVCAEADDRRDYPA